MSKGRRKRVGDFEYGDNIVAGNVSGKIASFPSRRIAVMRTHDGEFVEVSILDMKKEDIR